jgi:hypothetical protein
MIITFSAIAVFMAKTAFFWPTIVLGESQDDHDKRTEDFLNNDGFTKETLSDSRNGQLLKILDDFKMDYRKNYYDEVEQLAMRTVTSHFNQLDRIFNYNKIQIMRLRLVIQPDTIISINKSHNRENKYSVMRAYWVSDSGKRFLKFNVNLGNTDKVMFKNGEYDQQVLINASNEIKLKIRSLYEEKYVPL